MDDVARRMLGVIVVVNDVLACDSLVHGSLCFVFRFDFFFSFLFCLFIEFDLIVCSVELICGSYECVMTQFDKFHHQMIKK